MNTYRVTISGYTPVTMDAESVDEALVAAKFALGVQEDEISGDIDFIEVEINPIDI